MCAIVGTNSADAKPVKKTSFVVVTPNNYEFVVQFTSKPVDILHPLLNPHSLREEVKKADQEKAKTKSGILDCHCVLYVHALSSCDNWPMAAKKIKSSSP
jgi:hypothetical protein